MMDKTKAWTSDGFRVWAIGDDGTPKYLGSIICDQIGDGCIVLSGRMPDATWLKSAAFDSIELHYDYCGNPSAYEPDRIKFRCNVCRPVSWRIGPLGSHCREDVAIVGIHVTYIFEYLEELDSKEGAA